MTDSLGLGRCAQSMDSFEHLARGNEDEPEDLLSGDDVELEAVSPAQDPSLCLEQKMDEMLKFCKQHTLYASSVEKKLTGMDEKLSQLLEGAVPTALRRRASVISRALSKKQSSFKLELESPRSNSGHQAHNFDDIDQKLGLKVMKAARKWRGQEGAAMMMRRAKSQVPQLPASRGSSPKASGKPVLDTLEIPEPVEARVKQTAAVQFVPLPGDSVLPEAPGPCPILPSEPSGESAPRGEAQRAKSPKPKTSPNAGSASLNGSTGLTQSEVSLSNLFKHRESQLIPSSPEHRARESPKLPSPVAMDLYSTDEEAEEYQEPPKPTPKAMRVWLGFVGLWMRLCGLNPVVQWKTEFAEFTESPVPTLHALAVSKAYHCTILLLNFLFVVLAASSLAVCPDEALPPPQHPEPLAGAPPRQLHVHGDMAAAMCVTPLATDLAMGIGALLAVWSCGGLGGYFKSSRMQLQIVEHLTQEVDSTGLAYQWNSQKGVDALALGGIWLFVLLARLWMMGHDLVEPIGIAKLTFYALASACLLGACHVQMMMWRGISVTVVAFARSVLEGQVNSLQARQRWREVISCMRQTSRMFQLTAAALALTTILVSFAVLFDFDRRRVLAALPTLGVAAVLPVALYVAASATAHCTRLPSLVCMLEGDEEIEQEYMNLALFLTLSESGFFMWDTRVTLAVLQKFLYFTTAIVGTIGFQLKVFYF